ncbi:MAG: SCP2 sterol-binding domain-containing protein, partial [Candidatus Rokubacteria bacterium]|nr:SCP2 sterol-binding domain-containing protein [Candidatus Rokubacteria bacterium]
FAFRLWDGSAVNLGTGAPAFTISIHAPETFLRIIRDPSPLTFAEAFVEGALDVDGDLFAAMKVANVVEDLRLTRARRLRLFLSLLRPAP